MNAVALSLAYLRAKPTASVLNLLLLALGVATIAVLILFSRQFEHRLTRDARGVDLVIGAKGSPIQLILSAVYHVDRPTGNVPLSLAEQMRGHRLVKEAIPLALGDSFQGHRIVGTTHAYASLYGAEPTAGELWRDPFDAVIGAEAAKSTGLAIGDRFGGVHGVESGGEAHEERLYTVVGILRPTDTVIDRLILTAVDSVWLAHDPARNPQHAQRAGSASAPTAADLQVTALLIRYASPMAAILLPRQINSASAFQAAAPAQEITRLLSLVGVGLDTLRGFGLLLILSATLGVFIALYNAMQERRYDLAVMRALGAHPSTLFLQVLAEGLILSIVGTALGLAAGHGTAELLGRLLPAADAMGLTGYAWPAEEWWLCLLAPGVGLIAALIPAWQAYRTDIAATLASH
jgi:putative ABC transport system permease protein